MTIEQIGADELRACAKAIENIIGTEFGFALYISEMEKDNAKAKYISNLKRHDAIEFTEMVIEQVKSEN